MKTFGLLPSSPMVKQMNDVQWMYCYLNIAKDMEEEDNLFRMRAKYQGIFINPEAVKKVSEEEEKQKRKNMNANLQSQGKQELTEHQQEIIDNGGAVNTDFEKELMAALNGEQFMEIPIEGSVRGDSNMSSDEFLAKCLMEFDEEENRNNKDIDTIIVDDGDDEDEDVDTIIIDDDEDENENKNKDKE